MASFAPRMLLSCALFASLSHVYFADFTSSPMPESPCGDWVPYRNEKCIKVVKSTALQTKEDAEIVCKTFAEDFHAEDMPKLVTVKTEEKQIFLRKLIFEEVGLIDNVWLGLELGSDGVFRWNDGTALFFTNWIEEVADGKREEHERNCAQMESGEGPYEVGKWDKVNCRKRNAVVCERDQPWTVGTLQNILLSLQLEVLKNKQEFDQKLKEAKLETELLKANPVPVGFIYIQLSSQQPQPSSLWPDVVWEDISSNFAGLFFRVIGKNAGRFGDIQGENSPRLSQVLYEKGYDDNPIAIYANNAWSRKIYSGSDHGEHYGLRFKVSGGEVRPRNQAIKVWQRVK